jgi:fusion and transport protein UGO1
MLTPTTYPPRNLLPSLRLLPSLLCPPSLMPITILHSMLPSMISASTPLLLRSTYNLDPLSSPTTYSFLTGFGTLIQLAIQLPLETVLRRAQIAFPMNNSHELRTVVKTPQKFTGIVATVWEITRMEKATEKDVGPQGMKGLIRGWRVGAWSAVGLWGAGTMAGYVGSSEVGEF